MAWIVEVPPSPRHPRPRWQVRYQDGGRERSAGIYTTRPAAQAVKRRIERGDFNPDAPLVPEEAVNQHKALTLVGDYITSAWWPRWRDAHPHSAYLYGKRIQKRILPTFGSLRFVDLDADHIGDWKATLLAEGRTAQTINAYLSLLGTISDQRARRRGLDIHLRCRMRRFGRVGNGRVRDPRARRHRHDAGSARAG